MKKTSAASPELGGKMYHIGLSKGELPEYVLLPGDPDRVDLILDNLDTSRNLSCHREYKTGKGKANDIDIGVCSTGIGGPSTAIAIEELAKVGCNTFIRVGSTGALRKKIKCGDLIINNAAVRYEGTSKEYIFSEYPAVSDIEVTFALIQACEELGYKYHLGISASTDSFYVGQERPGFKDYLPSTKIGLLEDLRMSKVLNFEMEAATIFTLGNLYGLRTGCICTVFANRITDEFYNEGEDRAVKASIMAIKIISKWDELKRKNKKPYFYPGLLDLE